MMHNMRFVKEDEAVRAVGTATVGVFAWHNREGAPRSCAVTPYVVNGSVVVTSTLALPTKAFAVRRDPRVALLAGGWLIQGRASVGVDRTSGWFDRNIRGQEREKYPPGRALLALPFHRQLLRFYVGRVVVAFEDPVAIEMPGSDRATVTVTRDGALWIAPVIDLDISAIAIPIGAGLTGPADVLVHEESEDFAELRQLHRRGLTENGVVEVEHRSGSLEPQPAGTVAQLRQLHGLARLARGYVPELASWPSPTVEEQS